MARSGEPGTGGRGLRVGTVHICSHGGDPSLPHPGAAVSPGKFQTGGSRAAGEAAEQPGSCRSLEREKRGAEAFGGGSVHLPSTRGHPYPIVPQSPAGRAQRGAAGVPPTVHLGEKVRPCPSASQASLGLLRRVSKRSHSNSRDTDSSRLSPWGVWGAQGQESGSRQSPSAPLETDTRTATTAFLRGLAGPSASAGGSSLHP